MRKIVSLAALTTILCLALPGGFAKTPPSSKNAPATIVIIFKDGHRQTFNLADVARVEFPAAAETLAETAPANTYAPPRGRFVGKWEVGDGSGNTFYITLNENGDAWRSLRSMGGKWVIVDGEARITWNDGAQDAIRKAGSKYQKYAYAAGKSFGDEPDNVTSALNTTPQPI